MKIVLYPNSFPQLGQNFFSSVSTRPQSGQTLDIGSGVGGEGFAVSLLTMKAVGMSKMPIRPMMPPGISSAPTCILLPSPSQKVHVSHPCPLQYMHVRRPSPPHSEQITPPSPLHSEQFSPPSPLQKVHIFHPCPLQ